MKIDHSSGIQSQQGTVSVKNGKEGPGGSEDFASVLKKTTEKALLDKGSAIVPRQPVQTPLPAVDVKPGDGPENSAMHLLSAMENYQHKLADPSVNLRQVQEMVDQMKAVAAETAEAGRSMPSGHVVKDVIHEALIQIHKEIVRFERGEYVDG